MGYCCFVCVCHTVHTYIHILSVDLKFSLCNVTHLAKRRGGRNNASQMGWSMLLKFIANFKVPVITR